ncbi:MAG: DUF4340 domain-containing protein [Clostridia bacterium]|nr:DUF4340 domain-containing protein [Clostridia bacterium]
MKKSVKLLILLLVLAVLTGGYAAVRYFDTAKNNTDEVQEEQLIIAASLDSSAVTSLSWKNSNTEINLVLKENEWQYIEDSGFPVDQTYPEEILKAVSEVTASRIVSEAAEDLAQYGLEPPAYRAVMQFSDGSSTEYYIGNYSSAAGAYYFKTSASDSVYLVDDTLPTLFNNELLSIIEYEAIPSISDFSKLEITAGNKSTVIEALDGSKYSYTDLYKYFVVDGADYIPVDSDMAYAIETDVSSVAWSTCVDYTGKYEDFGLDNPSYKIGISYTDSDAKDSKLTLLIGTATDDGSYYACIEGSGMIYTVSDSVISSLLIDNAEEIYSFDMCRAVYYNVSELDITYKGKQYNFSVVRDIATDENGENTPSDVYTLNSKDADSSACDDFFYAFFDIKGTEYLAEDYVVSGDAVMSAKVVSDSGITEFKLYEYDESNYIVSIGGKTRITVAKADIEALNWNIA